MGAMTKLVHLTAQKSSSKYGNSQDKSFPSTHTGKKVQKGRKSTDSPAWSHSFALLQLNQGVSHLVVHKLFLHGMSADKVHFARVLLQDSNLDL
mmetsp:Transcript_111313/g.196513  ORF Transcript_111313/g.196513 Transcript_111313/m.196513 type:complete len:94 (-) Transcript_111313:378-659(-)